MQAIAAALPLFIIGRIFAGWGVGMVDSRVSIRVFSQVDSVSFPSFWTVTPVIAPRLLTCAIIKQRCRRLRLLMGDHYWPPYSLLRILTLSPVRSSHSTFVPRLCPFLSPLTGSGTSVSITLSGTLSTRSLVLLVWRSRCSSSGDPQYAGCFLFTYFCVPKVSLFVPW